MNSVTIRRIRLLCYKLPFQQPMVTALGIYRDRTGIIIQVMDGHCGLGDAAPLAGLGMESLIETARSLRHIQKLLIGAEISNLEDITNLLAPYQLPPAAKHGIELALLNLLAQVQGQSLGQLFHPQPRSAVVVNGLIGAVPVEVAAAQAQQLYQAGYRCIKVKVGDRYDLDRVKAVRAIVNCDCQIRIDANQAWTVAEAIAKLSKFTPYDIEYVEQPVNKKDLLGMAAVRRSVGIAIAADEAVTNLAELAQVIAYQAADIVVLKPMALGGLLTTYHAATIALAAGLDVVLTTTLDSAIARMGVLHLAAAMPQIRRACGLATGDLLAQDLLPSVPQPIQGAITLDTKMAIDYNP